DSQWKQWSTACASHGVDPARWQMLGTLLPPDSAARNLVQVLMQLPTERRPDALVVGDDHLVEEVAIGLLMSQLPAGGLPAVISHTNFPKLSRAGVPVTYLGFDSNRIIRSCVEILDAQRRGEEPPRRT